MGNLFLTFLGTNDYLECTYFSEDPKGRKEKASVRFVQEATLSCFCSAWGPEDRAVFFLTPSARRRNWEDDGHGDKEDNTLKRKGLRRSLKDLGLSLRIQEEDIPDGKNEEEIWTIFERVFDSIHEGDEIVFDLTHAFRSIPMLAMVILAYAKVVKDVKLKGIYYGALEVLGSYHEAEKLCAEERRVPIFDLTAYAALLEWSLGIDRFLRAGDASTLKSLTLARVRPLLKDSRGADQAAVQLRRIAQDMEDFSKVMSTCRIQGISQVVSSLKGRLTEVDHLDLIKPYKPLFALVQEELQQYPGEDVPDGIQAARWCLTHNLIQQGYTILQETVITHLLLQAGAESHDLRHRETASQAINIAMKKIPEHCWYPPAKENPALARKIVTLLVGAEDFLKCMDELSQRRNDLNHAGSREGAQSKPDVFRVSLAALITNVEQSLPHS